MTIQSANHHKPLSIFQLYIASSSRTHEVVAFIKCDRVRGIAVAVMSWSLFEYIFTEASADDRKKIIRWLQARNLLASRMICSCGVNMNLIQRDLQRGTTQDDKWAWKCPECTSIRSIRRGSWFKGELSEYLALSVAIAMLTT